MTIYTPSQADKKPGKDIVEPEVVTEPLTGEKKDKEAVAVVVNDTRVSYLRAKRRSGFIHMLLAVIVLAVLALGAIGSVVLYRHLNKKVYTGRCGNVFFDTAYHDTLEAPDDVSEQDYVEEDYTVSTDERYEMLHSPQFDEAQESFVLHDFALNYSAIIDHGMRRCFIAPIRSSIVQPSDFVLQIQKVSASGVRLQTVVVREDYVMVVPDRPFGKRIYMTCLHYQTYWLEPVFAARVKRSAHQQAPKEREPGKYVATYAIFSNNATHQELYKIRIHKPRQVSLE